MAAQPTTREILYLSGTTSYKGILSPTLVTDIETIQDRYLNRTREDFPDLAEENSDVGADEMTLIFFEHELTNDPSAIETLAQRLANAQDEDWAENVRDYLLNDDTNGLSVDTERQISEALEAAESEVEAGVEEARVTPAQARENLAEIEELVDTNIEEAQAAIEENNYGVFRMIKENISNTYPSKTEILTDALVLADDAGIENIVDKLVEAGVVTGEPAANILKENLQEALAEREAAEEEPEPVEPEPTAEEGPVELTAEQIIVGMNDEWRALDEDAIQNMQIQLSLLEHYRGGHDGAATNVNDVLSNTQQAVLAFYEEQGVALPSDATVQDIIGDIDNVIQSDPELKEKYEIILTAKEGMESGLQPGEAINAALAIEPEPVGEPVADASSRPTEEPNADLTLKEIQTVQITALLKVHGHDVEVGTEYTPEIQDALNEFLTSRGAAELDKPLFDKYEGTLDMMINELMHDIDRSKIAEVLESVADGNTDAQTVSTAQGILSAYGHELTQDGISGPETKGLANQALESGDLASDDFANGVFGRRGADRLTADDTPKSHRHYISTELDETASSSVDETIDLSSVHELAAKGLKPLSASGSTTHMFETGVKGAEEYLKDKGLEELPDQGVLYQANNGSFLHIQAGDGGKYNVSEVVNPTSAHAMDKLDGAVLVNPDQLREHFRTSAANGRDNTGAQDFSYRDAQWDIKADRWGQQGEVTFSGNSPEMVPG